MIPIFSSQLGKVEELSPQEAVRKMANYIRSLQEQLEYRLAHLDSDNITEIDVTDTSIITPEGNLYHIIGELGKDFAEFKMTIDEFSVTMQEYEETVDGYTRKVSEFEQTVDGFTMSVESYEETVSGYTEKVSTYEQTVEGFTQTVSSYEETVDGYTKQVSEFKQTVEGFTFSVENGGTSSVLTLKSGETELTSAEIKLTGVVTFNDLETEGKTTINGGNISTGKVSADHITLLDEMAVYERGTEGAENVLGGYIGYSASNLQDGGSGMVVKSVNGKGEMSVTESGARLSFEHPLLNSIYIVESHAAILTQGVQYCFTPEEGFYASKTVDDAYVAVDLGSASYLWGQIYSTNSVISTSDRKAKCSIEVLPESYLRLFDSLIPRRFKLNSGTSHRYHVGFIAQEVEEAMAAAGIASSEFGGFVKDINEDGEEIYMLRYEEFIGILAAKIQALEARITQEG